MREIAADLPGESIVVPADVRDADGVERVVERTAERFGRVDTLVNDAGVSILWMQDSRKRLVDVDEAEWDTVLDINLTGTFPFTRAALPHTIEQERGNVLNVSSGVGRQAIAGAGPYVSSNWGLEGLTRVTALEGEDHGVNANTLDPGGRVDTEIRAHLPDEERAEILPPFAPPSRPVPDPRPIERHEVRDEDDTEPGHDGQDQRRRLDASGHRPEGPHEVRVDEEQEGVPLSSSDPVEAPFEIGLHCRRHSGFPTLRSCLLPAPARRTAGPSRRETPFSATGNRTHPSCDRTAFSRPG